MYPEYFTAPMREELTRHGIEEARTAETVDAMLKPGSGSEAGRVSSVMVSPTEQSATALMPAVMKPRSPGRSSGISRRLGVNTPTRSTG